MYVYKVCKYYVIIRGKYLTGPYNRLQTIPTGFCGCLCSHSQTPARIVSGILRISIKNLWQVPYHVWRQEKCHEESNNICWKENPSIVSGNRTEGLQHESGRRQPWIPASEIPLLTRVIKFHRNSFSYEYTSLNLQKQCLCDICRNSIPELLLSSCMKIHG